MKTPVGESPPSTKDLCEVVPLLISAAQEKQLFDMKFKNPQKCVYVFVAFVSAAGLLAAMYALSVSPEFNQYRLVHSYGSSSHIDVPRTILLWNSFFGHKRWSLPDDTLGISYFRDDLKCRVYRCELTNARDFLPSVEMYDAVLFHTAEPFSLFNSVPPRRSSKQLYVFALMEPPGETKHILNDEGNFYNLTMTYRLDSDVPWTYQSVVDIQSNQVVAPAQFPYWRQPPERWNDSSVWQFWPGKTKTAAWFVSHCKTLSQREKLAAALQQFVDVDIFGKCGPFSCEYKAKECDDMIDQTYLFYFSFENSLCTDYITEKLYNAMSRNVIPVVFGGADYRRFVPPSSYINAEDFETTKQLADYLKYLSRNPEMYMRYFWWRRFYRLEYRSPFCDLCEKLHTAQAVGKTESYYNIEKWWLSSCRFTSKIKF